MDENLHQALHDLLQPRCEDGPDCSKQLYLFAADALPVDEMTTFRQHLQHCPRCQRDLEFFRTWQSQSPQPQPASVEKRWRWFGLVLTPVAIAASLLLLLWLPRKGSDESAFKIKGSYQLHVAVQRGKQRFNGVSGAYFANNDVLGFFYTAPAARYVYLMFADESETVAMLFPSDEPMLLPAGVEVALPDGAVLEPGQGCEWIVAVFAEQALARTIVEQALREALAQHTNACQLGSLPLAGASVDVFVLRRDPS